MTKFHVLALIILGACRVEAAEIVAGDAGGDAGTDPGDAATVVTADARGIAPDAEESETCTIPRDGYGLVVGRNLEPFTAPRCNGTTYSFYADAEYCGTELSIVVFGPWDRVGAWTDALDRSVRAEYGPDRVRIVTVLERHSVTWEPASAQDCTDFATAHGNGTVLRELSAIRSRVSDTTTTNYYVVDHTGTIVAVEVSNSMVLSLVREMLE